MTSFVTDIILVGGMNLHTGILGIDLPFDEALEGFWHPYVELNAPADTGDLEAQVFLVSPVEAKFFVVAEDTVEACKHLFCGELAFVVGLWDFKDKEYAFDFFDDIDPLVVAPGHVAQNAYDWEPNVPLE